MLQLQRLLKRSGYAVGPLDGLFGPVTAAALIKFQREHSLAATGHADAESWARLQNSALSPGDAIDGLQAGSTGQAVSVLQRSLKAAGFDAGGVDGKFGMATDRALRAFQRSRGLDPDGVAGDLTWRELRANATSDRFGGALPARVDGVTVRPLAANEAEVRQRIVEIAGQEVGTIEATNRNDGAALRYPNFFGRGAEAWCDDFVSWVSTMAGVPMNQFNTENTRATLIADGRWKGVQNPRPGDLVLFDWNHDHKSDHIGILKSVNANGTYTTIEGNTARAGYHQGVWEKTRTLDTILGFGDPV